MTRSHLQLVCDKCSTPMDVTSALLESGRIAGDFVPVSTYEITRSRFKRWIVPKSNVADPTVCDQCQDAEASA